MIFVALLSLIAGWHPLVVATRTAPATPQTRNGLIIGTAVVGVLAVMNEPILDLLRLSPPTFRTAAGAVVGLTGLRWLVGTRPRRDDPTGDDLLTGVLAVLTPAPVLAALSMGADYGWLVPLLGLTGSLGATWAIAVRSPDTTATTWGLGVRAVGLVAVGTGILVLVDGIRSV